MTEVILSALFGGACSLFGWWCAVHAATDGWPPIRIRVESDHLPSLWGPRWPRRPGERAEAGYLLLRTWGPGITVQLRPPPPLLSEREGRSSWWRVGPVAAPWARLALLWGMS